MRTLLMATPTDRRYLESHEWHKLEGDTVVIGITQHAADELTDITYVQLPKVGTKLAAKGRFGKSNRSRRPAICTPAWRARWSPSTTR